MTDSLSELIAEVHTLHPDGDALAQLSEAMVIAQRLNDHADHLIGHFVDQARRAGASWTAIGESMGVTKQAAQKRFVPRMQDEPRGADARMFERFTERARRAITLAQDEARSLKNEHIDSEHVLLGLMAEGHGLAALALQAQDVTLERLRDAVAAAGAPTVAEPPRQIPFAPRAKKLLQLGVREALQLGHNYVGTEHLLLAVFTDDGGIGAAVLAEAGVTEAATRDWLAAEFDKYLGRT